MPKKKPNYKEITWTQLRGLYGSGLFVSVQEMYPHAKKLYGTNCPGISAIQQRSAKENWKKTLYRERIEVAQERSFQKMFDDAGFSDEVMVKKIVDGVNHSEAIFNKVLKKVEESKGEITPEIAESLKEFVNDLKISHRYIAERNKLTGSYSATKVRGAGEKLGIDDVPESIEEQWAEHERLLQSIQD